MRIPWDRQPIAIGIRPTVVSLFLAVFPARNPKSKVPRPGEHCQDVLCACNDFFIIIIHRFFCLVSCPKQGTVLRTQDLKSNPTAAGGAVKADRSPESFRGEERLAHHEPPDRCFFCVRLVTAILRD